MTMRRDELMIYNLPVFRIYRDASAEARIDQKVGDLPPNKWYLPPCIGIHIGMISSHSVSDQCSNSVLIVFQPPALAELLERSNTRFGRSGSKVVDS